jgi:hypothetical protein
MSALVVERQQPLWPSTAHPIGLAESVPRR